MSFIQGDREHNILVLMCEEGWTEEQATAIVDGWEVRAEEIRRAHARYDSAAGRRQRARREWAAEWKNS